MDTFEVTPTVAYWLGAILTDGSFAQGRTHKSHWHRIVFGSIDREFCEAVNDGCEELIGRRYAIMHRPRNDRPFWVMQMTNSRLWAWAFQITHGKQRVPTEILNASDDIKLAFLAGVMDGDGWISVLALKPNATRRNPSQTFGVGVFSCDPWIWDVKRLTDSLGLVTTGPKIRKAKSPQHRDGHDLRFRLASFAAAELPLRIERKKARLEGLRRHLESSETTRSAYADLWATDRTAYNRENQRAHRARKKI